jgi:hypothetical protein
MAFYIDDVPAEPFLIDLLPETIVPAQFTAASAVIIDPAGVSTATTATITVDGSIEVDWPATSVFTVEGIYRIRVTLTSATASQRLPDVRIVAQDPDSEWHTLDSIREDWPDGETIPDATLYELLDVVRGQVLDFAPVLAVAAPVPARYRLAQRVQVRNTWNAAKVSPAGEFGGDEFVIRPFPLDWHVKQILRPKRGVPVVA